MPYPKEDHEAMKKPWGGYERFIHNRKSTVKILTVKKGSTLSLQSHRNRDEIWIPLDSGLRVEIDGKVSEPKPEEIIFIPRGAKHRLSSIRDARMLEISLGDFHERDIIRYQDKYGRKGSNEII